MEDLSKLLNSSFLEVEVYPLLFHLFLLTILYLFEEAYTEWKQWKLGSGITFSIHLYGLEQIT